MNSKKNILLLISSKSTPRIYLILLKQYLQRTIPDATINYFISAHDDSNETVRKSVYAESEKLKKDVDVLIGLDGYLPKNLLKHVKGKKYLLNLPDVGEPTHMETYFAGYDYLVVFDKDSVEKFKKKCKKKGVEILLGKDDPFKLELSNLKEKERARKDLIMRYPQISGKRILAITTRGFCNKKYIEKYKGMNLRKILKELPEDVILMSNCPQLELAAASLPQKYSEKYIVFGQRELIDVLMNANWNYTNIGLSKKTDAEIRKIAYSGNAFEKEKNDQCIKLWACEESILREFGINSGNSIKERSCDV